MFTAPLSSVVSQALSSSTATSQEITMSSAPLSAFTVEFAVNNLTLTLFVSVNGAKYTVHEDNRSFNDILRLVMDDRTSAAQLEYALQAARRDDLQRF